MKASCKQATYMGVMNAFIVDLPPLHSCHVTWASCRSTTTELPRLRLQRCLSSLLLHACCICGRAHPTLMSSASAG